MPLRPIVIQDTRLPAGYGVLVAWDAFERNDIEVSRHLLLCGTTFVLLAWRSDYGLAQPITLTTVQAATLYRRFRARELEVEGLE